LDVLVVVIKWTLHVRVIEQTIERQKRRRFHLHIGGGRNLRSLQDQRANLLHIEGLARLDFQTQHILHRILTFVGGQFQQLQIALVGHLLRMLLQEHVISHPKMARGKHLFAVLVILERAGLTNQGINHVPVIHGGSAASHKPRHPLDEDALMRDLDPLGPDLGIHRPANQPTGNRIHVLSHMNRAALMNAKAREHLIRIEPMIGQSAQMLLLSLEQRPAM
jgi:hypothetical protein